MAQGNVISRFIDAGKEPSKTLTPIKGYEKSELVSLEKAVAEIEPPVDDINSMVWTAKRNSRNPTDGLTSDESASIHLYSVEWSEAQQSLYFLLNERLRSEDRNKLKSWFPYLKLFFTALHKLPSLKKTIWRGIRGNVSDLYEDDCIWWGVSSCTESINIMEKFVGRSGARTLFMIECIHGKAIKSHSFYKDESEIILMPGTYLRVIGKWSPSDDLYIIHLQEETPPCQLVAPPFTPSSSSVDIPPLNKTSVSKTGQGVPIDTSSSIATSSLSKDTVFITSQPDLQNTSTELYSSLLDYSISLASMDDLSLEKPSISKPSQLNNQAVANQSYKSMTKPSLLSSPPTYQNKELIQMINENKYESDLYWSQKDFTSNDIALIAYYLLQNNRTLKQLKLWSNEIGDRGAEYLGEALQKNKTLTSLDLSSNQIGERGAEYLGKALQNNTTLTSLDLASNQIGDRGAEYLGETLQKNTTLTELNIPSNEIGDRGVQYLSQALQKNTTFTTLNLSSNQIGGRGAEYLGEALQKNKTLTMLSLNGNQIGDRGVEYLGQALQKNTILTEIILSSNEIGDRGAEDLGEALQKNRTLTILDISFNEISDRGAEYLGKALRRNTTLTELYLSHNKIGDVAMKRLPQALLKKMAFLDF